MQAKSPKTQTTLPAHDRPRDSPDAAWVSLIDRLPDGVLLLDRDWRITYANPAACRISRLTPANFHRETHWELYPETLGTPIEEGYRAAMADGQERTLQPFFWEPHQLWINIRILPIASGIALYYEDVTEARRQTEGLATNNRTLDSQRVELEAIYSASPIGLTLYSPVDFRILRINERNAQVLGLTPETAMGKTVQEVAPEMTSAFPLLERAARGEAIHGQIVQGKLPGTPGVLRTFNVNYKPLFRPDGSVRGIASASLEITDQKRAEIALIQSEKLAAVGRMASSIAHEINNPLESVTNLLYIANQSPSLVEVRHFLDLADQELRRVSIIVNQTLRFHKQASSPRDITCIDLFSTVLSMFEGKLRNSSVVVEKRKRAERSISCFEGDIRQVLNNLVGNAIDAMPHGGRLLLRSREATDWRTGRKGVALTIADTGFGISAADKEHIFEAFFTTKGNQGTGLGLWISAEILARHEGHLLVRSSQRTTRHGSVFAIFLPFDAVPVATTMRPN